MSTESQDLRQKIHRFVVNNTLLESLNARLHRFNPFSVLKVDRFEIRHSNVLAWLLNPVENHGLGDIVLKKFIAEVLCGDVVMPNHRLQVMDILLHSFNDAEVLREWRNIDILVISKANGVALLIENKIHAGVSNPLDRYVASVRNAFPKIIHIIPVLLTLHGDDSPHPAYYSLGHERVLDIVQSVLSLYRDRMATQVYDFIHYYAEIMEELMMQDEQLIQLCRDLYKHHKEAIDVIIKYGLEESTVLGGVASKLREEHEWVDHASADKMFANPREHWFVPLSLSGQMPKLRRKWKSIYPISYFFAAETERQVLRLILEVGPIEDENTRSDLLQHLGDQVDVKLFRFSDASTSYTRIRVAKVRIDDWDDVDHVVERARHLLDEEFHYADVNAALLNVLKRYPLGQPGDMI